MISALSLLPSLRMTLISSASAMTWLLVTTMPGGVDDEAGAERVDAARPRCGLPLALRAAAVLEEVVEEFLERRIRAAAAAPASPLRTRPFCEVEMLTTASITFSATSAILPVRARRWAWPERQRRRAPPRQSRPMQAGASAGRIRANGRHGCQILLGTGVAATLHRSARTQGDFGRAS